jgi:hypothetical protein
MINPEEVLTDLTNGAAMTLVEKDDLILNTIDCIGGKVFNVHHHLILLINHSTRS